MKFEDLSLRQISVGVLAIGLFGWTWSQFVILPELTVGQRKQLYSGWYSTPYSYVISFVLTCFAMWFVFRYRGPLTTQKEGM